MAAGRVIAKLEGDMREEGGVGAAWSVVVRFRLSWVGDLSVAGIAAADRTPRKGRGDLGKDLEAIIAGVAGA